MRQSHLSPRIGRASRVATGYDKARIVCPLDFPAHVEELAPCAKLVFYIVLAYLRESQWQSMPYQQCFVCLPRPRMGCRPGAWTCHRLGERGYDVSATRVLSLPSAGVDNGCEQTVR